MTESNKDDTLKKSLESAKNIIMATGLPILGCYNPTEVCKILGISWRTFSRMTNEYEPHPETGKPVKPGTLNSFQIRGQKRVPFTELAAFLARNNTYEKQNSFLIGIK